MKTLHTLVLSLFSFAALAQNPLIIPPTLSGTTFNLTLQDGTHEFVSGTSAASRGFNGDVLGPTLIFEQGDVVDISVENQLNESTTVHWHGMHVPAIADGGPHTAIAAGATWNPSFTVMDKASTMWYHPHVHEQTYKQVHMGLAGFIIIKDTEEAALDLPRTYGVDDIPVVFQTKVMDGSGQLDSDRSNSGMDHLFVANATTDAFVDVPAQVIRLRLLNGAAERTFNIGLSNGADFHVIASDGGLLEAPVQMNRLQFSQGERYEILIDLSGMNGNSIDIVNYGTGIPGAVYGTASGNIGMGGASIPNYASNPLNGADFTMLTLNVGASTANPVVSIPTSLVTVNEWSAANVDVEREIVMSALVMGPDGALNGPFQFNGAPFNMNVVNEEIILNDTEIWTISNQSMISHPFHIHDIQFNILEIGGVTPPAHMQGWKDVVLVPPFQGTAKFITRFEDFVDPDIPYMYHCHILTHEDDGMMGQFVVLEDPNTIAEYENDEVSLYPNPVQDKLLIGEIDAEQLQIFNVNGQRVLRVSNRPVLDVSQLTSGMYFLRAGNKTGTFLKK